MHSNTAGITQSLGGAGYPFLCCTGSWERKQGRCSVTVGATLEDEATKCQPPVGVLCFLSYSSKSHLTKLLEQGFLVLRS